jgi:hypothetical protein
MTPHTRVEGAAASARPVRMYFCGPTVYQTIHIGNARPFVLSMWLKRWLERTGYDVTLVENITDVNDKIYAAAPGDSARLAAGRERLVRRGHQLARARPPGPGAEGDRVHRRDRRDDRELIASGARLPVRRRRLLPRRQLPGLRQALGPPRRRGGDEEPSEEAEEARLKDDPRDFALWKGHKEGEDTWWESPGAAAARAGTSSARRWPRRIWGPFRDPRRRHRPGLPPPRERDRPVARARPRVRAALDAQRDAAALRREDVQVGRQHRLALRGRGEVGARDPARLLSRRSLA